MKKPAKHRCAALEYSNGLRLGSPARWIQCRRVGWRATALNDFKERLRVYLCPRHRVEADRG